MIKYEYKVIKQFTIITNGEGDRVLGADIKGEKNVSTFSIGNMYVDYEFSNEDIVQCKITGILLKKGFIVLLKKSKK